jgi:hypothetical protein
MSETSVESERDLLEALRLKRQPSPDSSIVAGAAPASMAKNDVAVTFPGGAVTPA